MMSSGNDPPNPYESPDVTAVNEAPHKHQRLVWLHFAACPVIAFVGAASATNFPFLPNDHSAYEIGWLQCTAIVSACFVSFFPAFLLQSSVALQQGRCIRHFAWVLALLITNHFLWVEPIWGFHHDHSLGVFAWLFIGGDDGFSVVPNYITILPTIVCSYLAHVVVKRRLVLAIGG